MYRCKTHGLKPSNTLDRIKEGTDMNHDKEINDLLLLRRYFTAMKFGVDDMHNIACAKTAVDYIDKAVEAYKAEKAEDVSEHGDG